MNLIFYLFGLCLELIFILSFTIFWIYLIYSDLKGSPFVPSKKREVDFILKEAGFKKGQKLYDLGCGDGRVIREAAAKYHIVGTGVDVNPFLIWYARFMSRIQKVQGVTFRCADVFKVNIRNADVVYVFLMPKILKRLLPKFQKELRKGARIISHGFKIEGLEKRLVQTIFHAPFPTYFYRM